MEARGQPLRVLVADGEPPRLAVLAGVVSGLGHEVIAREIEVSAIAAAIAREGPDIALVELGVSWQHGLDLIETIVQESTCPVIALLPADDAEYVREAAERGVFACVLDSSPEDLQTAIEVTLQRFSEYRNLQQAFGRRAVIEQAKGILMGRNAIDGEAAFRIMRDHSQRNGRKLVEVAEGIVANYLLLSADQHSDLEIAP
jgi:AmiR/NasT family two-component response regulator